MAFIGLRHPVVATVNTETAGSALTYNAGMVVGHAILANLTINRNTNPLYGDDVVVEDDNSITSMSIELGVDDIAESVRLYMLGLTSSTSGTSPNTVTTYNETAAAAPYVGFGYIRVRRLNNATTFQAYWCKKVQFGQTAENAQTKGETIEWQTPTLTGRVMGVYDGSDASNASYRIFQNFDTEAAAITWLNSQAGIS